MTFGDSTEEGQALQPTIIEFMVLTACLFNMEMEIFRPQKTNILYGVNRNTAGQERTLYGVNMDLSVTERNLICCQ